jgi:hypothetical protein
MDADLKRELTAYLKDRSPEGFLRLRGLVTGSRTYAPYSDELGQFQTLYRRAQYRKAASFLRGHLGNWLLSPRAHQMLAATHEKLGETEAAEMEKALAWLMLEGLLSTGDGTEAAPYQVTRLEDEYDLLEYLEKETTGQALVEANGRKCDRHTCEDGAVLYFDVTVPRATLKAHFESGSDRKPWQFWRR